MDADGLPDFRALVGGQNEKVAWCFDLLEVDGRDMRPFPLVTRRARLKALIKKAADERLQYSDSFADPLKLLAALDERKMEGIVSKKTDQPYQSGKNSGWVKVKCHAWREANAGRWELLQRK